MNNYGIKIGLTLILVSLLIFIAALFQSVNIFDKTEKIVIIPAGASTSQVESILEVEGILRPDSSFTVAAKVLGLSKNIQAGSYKFSPSQNLIKVLLKLKRGEVIPPDQIKVTFPEGTSIYKMGEVLKGAGYADYKKLQALTSLEGYLYPDTYNFYPEAKVDVLVDTMVNRFDQIVMPVWDKTKKDTKYNLHEILTLASIIEKEAQKPEERTIISSVYHNRLNKRMYLAACPTIKYALERPTKKVYLDQLEVDSPYNTYKNFGLPPGPICNPGIESIKAAIYPAKTNFYFFVAKPDGSHEFSKTYEGHQRAKNKQSSP